MKSSETNIVPFEEFFNLKTDLDYIRNVTKSEDFDWDVFFTNFHENLIFESIAEPNLIKDEIGNNHSRHLEYEFFINDVRFLGIVDAVKCKIEIESLKQDIVKHQMRKIKTDLIEDLRSRYEQNPNSFVLKYQFRDFNNNTSFTNKMGNLAFLVLQIAKKVFLTSVGKIGLTNVFCFEIHVAKNESRRLELYKKMIERSPVNDNFPNEYIDSVTDDKYITYYRWKN
jgi:hypothetical protein